MAKRDRTKASLKENVLHQLGFDIPETLLEFYDLLEIMRCFGICGAYRHLEHPEVSPETCLMSSSRTLDLLAWHGEKWLFEPWFEPQLDRFRLRKGKVRFLLSENIEPRTRTRLSELVDKHECFEARLFSGTPKFRLVIMDDARLLLGHYGYEVIEGDGTNAKGWKSPQLLVNDNQSWSFLIPMRDFYREIWETSEIVGATVRADDAKPAKKREFVPIPRP